MRTLTVKILWYCLHSWRSCLSLAAFYCAASSGFKHHMGQYFSQIIVPSPVVIWIQFAYFLYENAKVTLLSSHHTHCECMVTTMTRRIVLCGIFTLDTWCCGMW